MKVQLFYCSCFPKNRKARHRHFVHRRERDVALAKDWLTLLRANHKLRSFLEAFIAKPGSRKIDDVFARCRGANPQIAAYYWGDLCAKR